MGELFAADVRALAASMATLLNWAFSFTMTLVFAQLNAALGPAGTPLPLLGHLGQSRVISGHLGSSRARRHLLPLLGHLRRRRRLCGGVPPRDKGAESGGGAGALWQRGELEQARAQRHPSVERGADRFNILSPTVVMGGGAARCVRAVQGARAHTNDCAGVGDDVREVGVQRVEHAHC